MAHADSAGVGAVSRVEITQSPVGPQPWPGSTPFRGRQWSVARTFTGLGAGAVRDLAFDDAINRGAWPDARSPLVPGLEYARHSGKGLVKLVQGAPLPASLPQLLLVADGAGDLRVVDLTSGAELARHTGLDVTALGHYWRQ